MQASKTQAQAPARSLDQRMDALRRANDIRVRRAQLKKDLKAGACRSRRSSSQPPEYVETAKVFDILMAVPKFGRVKAARFLNQCRISQSKTVGGLSERQRTELVGLSAAERARLELAPRPASSSPARRGPARGRSSARLVARRPDLELAVSATTRAAAAGEVDGREYCVPHRRGVRAARRRRGDFLEHVVYVSGHRYGTLNERGRADPRRRARAASSSSRPRARGACKELRPDAVTIFVAAPSFDELERRLRARATESSGEIDERLELARAPDGRAGRLRPRRRERRPRAGGRRARGVVDRLAGD